MNFFKKNLFLILLSISICIFIFSIGLYFNTEYNNILQKNKFRINYLNKEKFYLIKSHLESSKKDLFFISNIYKNFEKKEELNNIIKIFSSENPIYSQIRYLNSNGLEIVRINNKNRKISSVLGKKLQNKFDRYYFKESLKLNENEIYLSLFDLNIENSVIERPFNPTIRFSTPIYNYNNKLDGYAIINYSGEKLLNLLKQNKEYDFLLLNRESNYLISTEHLEYEWNFMFEKYSGFKTHKAKVWKKLIESQDSLGIFKKGSKYYSFIVIDPIEIVSPNRNEESRRKWYLVSYFDEEQIMEEFLVQIKSLMWPMFFIFLILLVASNMLFYYLKKLQKIQEQLIESDKLSALGQLIAGITHEINSPLGAIKTSSSNVLDALKKSIKNRPKLDLILNENEKQILSKLQNNVEEHDVFLSIKEQRILKKELYTKLEENKINDSRFLSDTLSSMGIKNFQDYIPLLKHTEAKFIFKTVNDEYTTVSNMKNIQNSVKRVSQTIFALKKFTYFNHDKEGIYEKLENEIENVLLILRHNLKHNIEIVRDYKKLEPIFCYPDELGQVWMNLIQNATHAMNNKGTIKISIYEDEKYQIVSISDTGKGIPAEIKNKIFKPFFTTKQSGVGSGLGLDIVLKVIESHNGKIEFKSTEKGTTFFVKIPKRRKVK